MAADGRLETGGPRERRPAIWPWLLMPVIVLLVFYALYRMHRTHAAALAPPAPAASTPTEL